MNLTPHNKHNNCDVYIIHRPGGIALECADCVVLKGKRKGKPAHIQWLGQRMLNRLEGIGIELRTVNDPVEWLIS